MLKYLIGRKLDAAERELGASLDYVRHILRTSLSDFLDFTKVLKLAERPGVLPADVRAVAGLVATRAEGCGSCVQIAINQGLAAGVPSDVLRAAFEDRVQDLPPDAALGQRFARAVLEHAPEAEDLRAALRERFGERALTDLALVITAARSFPTIKRALGYATPCRLQDLDFAGTAQVKRAKRASP
jgi:alkylhydroperoxidase family enzyme